MVTAAVVDQAFINIFASLLVGLQGKSYRATAADSSGSILAGAITSSIIYSTCFNAGSAIGVKSVFLVATTHGACFCVIAGVLTASISIVTS